MPTIKQLQKNKTFHNPTEMREIRAKAYNTTAWRKLSKEYKQQHPLCERCLSEGKYVPAIDIHHKKSPFSINGTNMTLLLDPDNLEALCKECHQKEHNKTNIMPPDKQIELLDALLEIIDDDTIDDDSK